MLGTCALPVLSEDDAPINWNIEILQLYDNMGWLAFGVIFQEEGAKPLVDPNTFGIKTDLTSNPDAVFFNTDGTWQDNFGEEEDQSIDNIYLGFNNMYKTYELSFLGDELFISTGTLFSLVMSLNTGSRVGTWYPFAQFKESSKVIVFKM